MQGLASILHLRTFSMSMSQNFRISAFRSLSSGSRSLKNAVNCLWFNALTLMKLSFSSDIHYTSCCVIQCKNTNFSSGFMMVILILLWWWMLTLNMIKVSVIERKCSQCGRLWAQKPHPPVKTSVSKGSPIRLFQTVD